MTRTAMRVHERRVISTEVDLDLGAFLQFLVPSVLLEKSVAVVRRDCGGDKLP